MMEKVSIKDLSLEEKKLLLKELGYNSDDVFVLDEKKEPLIDKYTEEPIQIENMVIFPGSAIILDNNPVSIFSYLEDYPDVSLF